MDHRNLQVVKCRKVDLNEDTNENPRTDNFFKFTKL